MCVQVDICVGLRKQLATANLEKVHILRKLKHRIQDFIPELRLQFDKVRPPVFPSHVAMNADSD